ncbi:MAG: VOC family protein [Bacteroidota bacterium]|nr:VOC family protein [Bacteroidota bacterium]
MNDVMVSPVVTVKNLDRAREFYEDKLDLKYSGNIMDDEIIFSSNGGEVLVMQVDDKQPSNHTVLTFEVNDIEKERDELKNKGISFEEYDDPNFKTEDGICTLGNDKSAWFKDPEGNVLCIHQKG